MRHRRATAKSNHWDTRRKMLSACGRACVSGGGPHGARNGEGGRSLVVSGWGRRLLGHGQEGGTLCSPPHSLLASWLSLRGPWGWEGLQEDATQEKGQEYELHGQGDSSNMTPTYLQAVPLWTKMFSFLRPFPDLWSEDTEVSFRGLLWGILRESRKAAVELSLLI